MEGKNSDKPPDVPCRNPGLNQGPYDLQSHALPTELFRLPSVMVEYNVTTKERRVDYRRGSKHHPRRDSNPRPSD